MESCTGPAICAAFGPPQAGAIVPVISTRHGGDLPSTRESAGRPRMAEQGTSALLLGPPDMRFAGHTRRVVGTAPDPPAGKGFR
jgi:hypothetical protein